jgi:GNAT superfamily N-acetyltransferase
VGAIVTLTIRALTEADLDRADRVAMAAYRASSSRIPDLALYLRLQPDGWLIAEVDGEPAGLCGALDFGAFATIGLMGVHPSFQRRGIARALLEHLLHWLDTRQVPLTLLDASDMGATLYPQYGFAECGRTVQLRRTAITAPDAGEDAGDDRDAAFPLTIDMLPLLAAFDMPFFGADRAAVLEHYYRAQEGRTFCTSESPPLPAGYIMARPAQVGPWVAATPADAEVLLRAALALPFEDGPVVNVPAENEDALALLARYGFTPQRALRHMYRGAQPPSPRTQIYGQASFTIG